MNKTIIVINGKGGCGKDTLCDIAAKHYAVLNVSSITPIKEMASIIGWEGAKTENDRKFLSDLKALVTQYNDGANNYLLKMTEDFISSDNEIMFVHIREPESIEHFKETVVHLAPEIKVLTLLVKREIQKYYVFGNKSDDEVGNYSYDFIYDNNTDVDKIEETFMPFFENMLNFEEKADICALKNTVYNHIMVIKNNTKRAWKNTFLRVIMSETDSGPECANSIFENIFEEALVDHKGIFGYPLPDLAPGEETKINVQFNTGRNTGIFHCCCIVVDKNLNFMSIENVYALDIKVIEV